MMDRFGEKLRTLRKRQGFTLRQLGEMLEVHHTYVSQLEKGKTSPNATIILKIAAVFDVTTDQLMKDNLDLDE